MSLSVMMNLMMKKGLMMIMWLRGGGTLDPRTLDPRTLRHHANRNQTESFLAESELLRLAKQQDEPQSLGSPFFQFFCSFDFLESDSQGCGCRHVVRTPSLGHDM